MNDVHLSVIHCFSCLLTEFQHILPSLLTNYDLLRCIMINSGEYINVKQQFTAEISVIS